MDRKTKQLSRGSVLFEALLALVILTFGVVGCLKVFSQSLFVDKRNRERSYVQQHLDRLLFNGYAYPVDVMEGRNERIIHLPGEEGMGEYYFKVEADLIAEESRRSNPDENTGVLQLAAGTQYYRARVSVLRSDQSPVYDFETLISAAGKGKRP